MCSILFVLAVGLAVVTAVPTPGRIVGGGITTIDRYPMTVVILASSILEGPFWHICGGCIINNKAILSAAHCFNRHPPNYRARVGSTSAHSGGVVHTIARIFNHPDYNPQTIDNDVTVIHAGTAFVFNNNVRQANIAGPNYILRDNEIVWAVGWGRENFNGPISEELRHVQVWVVNQEVCRNNYAWRGFFITENMLCSGWLNVGSRDQCNGDSGSPLLHNNNVVGVSSWGHQCARRTYPGVNVRVSRFANWIQANA